MLFGISIWKLLIALVVVLLLFGNRLPSVARSLGQPLPDFKKPQREIEDGTTENVDGK
jgi:TatA/E family protein of Tat protein translocase